MLVNVLYDHFHEKAIINNSNAAGVQIQSNVGPSVSNLPLIGLWNIGDGCPGDWQLMRSNTSQLHSVIVTKRLDSLFGQGGRKTIKYFSLIWKGGFIGN